jgi:hypothetical protein
VPVSQSKLQQLNDMMDAWLQQRQQDRLDGIDDDDDEDTDPEQFLYQQQEPVAEPPTTIPQDSAKRKDLFR